MSTKKLHFFSTNLINFSFILLQHSFNKILYNRNSKKPFRIRAFAQTEAFIKFSTHCVENPVSQTNLL